MTDTIRPAEGYLSEQSLAEIRALPARFPEIRSAVMPALDLAQEELGYLTTAAMAQVAGVLDLDPGYVEGVATFYTLFHLQPVGRHHFYVCTNLSCALRGAYDICSYLLAQTGVSRFGEVSQDGLFSVEEVECLGACEYAPMLRYQHAYHYDLTPVKIDALVEAARREDDRPAAVEPPPAETAPAPIVGPSEQGTPAPPQVARSRRRRSAGTGQEKVDG
ncbi:MAG: NAD(P)H-dependent oxidoreductase subunit E [Candidatus Dormibacteraeota bacterium]|nr:NAD(P)H-dependent oxidoreductase subunit E [Candidatus Dormibacteraeota bacterium]